MVVAWFGCFEAYSELLMSLQASSKDVESYSRPGLTCVLLTMRLLRLMASLFKEAGRPAFEKLPV